MEKLDIIKQTFFQICQTVSFVLSHLCHCCLLFHIFFCYICNGPDQRIVLVEVYWYHIHRISWVIPFEASRFTPLDVRCFAFFLLRDLLLLYTLPVKYFIIMLLNPGVNVCGGICRSQTLIKGNGLKLNHAQRKTCRVQ